MILAFLKDVSENIQIKKALQIDVYQIIMS